MRHVWMRFLRCFVVFALIIEHSTRALIKQHLFKEIIEHLSSQLINICLTSLLIIRKLLDNIFTQVFEHAWAA